MEVDTSDLFTFEALAGDIDIRCLQHVSQYDASLNSRGIKHPPRAENLVSPERVTQCFFLNQINAASK